MRHLTLLAIILLTLAICSCRSTKSVMADSATSAEAVSASTVTSETRDDVLSIITTVGSLDLEDIVVDFYQPDSTTAVAAPRSLTIKSARQSRSSTAERVETTTSAASAAINFHGAYDSTETSSSNAETTAAHPDNWHFILVFVLLTIALIIGLKYIKDIR